MSAGLLHFCSQSARFVHSKDQDPATDLQLANSGGSLQTIHDRHGEIQNYNVWLQRSYCLNRITSVRRFTTNFPASPRSLYQRANTFADDVMIIGYYDSCSC